MKNDREKLRSQLSAYLDGELPPDQAERLTGALAEDDRLRAELEALDATRNLLRQLPRDPAPPGMVEAVMDQAERNRLLAVPHQATQRRPLVWIRYLAVAAILAVTAGLGIYLYGTLNEGWVSRQDPGGGTHLARKTAEPAPTVADDRAQGWDDLDGATIASSEGDRAGRRAPAKALGKVDREGGEYSATPKESIESAGTPTGSIDEASSHLAKAEEGRSAKPAAVEGERDSAKRTDLEPYVGNGVLAEPVAKSPADTLASQEEVSREVSVAAKSDAAKGGAAGKWNDSLVLELGQRELVMGQTSAGVHNVVLNTTDLERTNARVLAVLAANRIRGDMQPGIPIRGKVAMNYRTRGGSHFIKRTSPYSNDIVFYVDAVDAPRVIEQIQRIDGQRSGSFRAAGAVAGARPVDAKTIDEKTQMSQLDKPAAMQPTADLAQGGKGLDLNEMPGMAEEMEGPAKPKRPSAVTVDKPATRAAPAPAEGKDVVDNFGTALPPAPASRPGGATLGHKFRYARGEPGVVSTQPAAGMVKELDSRLPGGLSNKALFQEQKSAGVATRGAGQVSGQSSSRPTSRASTRMAPATASALAGRFGTQARQRLGRLARIIVTVTLSPPVVQREQE